MPNNKQINPSIDINPKNSTPFITLIIMDAINNPIPDKVDNHPKKLVMFNGNDV